MYAAAKALDKGESRTPSATVFWMGLFPSESVVSSRITASLGPPQSHSISHKDATSAGGVNDSVGPEPPRSINITTRNAFLINKKMIKWQDAFNNVM